MDLLVASPQGRGGLWASLLGRWRWWVSSSINLYFCNLGQIWRKKHKNTWYTADSVSITFGEVPIQHFHGIELMPWISLPSTPTIDRDQGSRVRIWLLGSLGLLLVWMGRMHRMGGWGGSLNESEVVYTLLLTGMSEQSIESRDQAMYKGAHKRI